MFTNIALISLRIYCLWYYDLKALNGVVIPCDLYKILTYVVENVIFFKIGFPNVILCENHEK